MFYNVFCCFWSILFRVSFLFEKSEKKLKKGVAFSYDLCYTKQADSRKRDEARGLVAQLDRVFDYESKGRGFESRRAHQ